MSLDLTCQYEKIYKFCYFKTKSCDLAEDLTQETFLRYFSQHTYIERGKPLAYLYTIARNLCIDSLKKPIEYKLWEEEIPNDRDEMGAADLAASIRQEMEKLPKKQQELLWLRYINELSMAEISQITGLSRFAARRSIQNGIKELKNMLKEEDFYG